MADAAVSLHAASSVRYMGIAQVVLMTTWAMSLQWTHYDAPNRPATLILRASHWFKMVGIYTTPVSAVDAAGTNAVDRMADMV